ncbi:MAG TPA: hypothetical protein VHX38_01885 [Pseudonocardiaceae bacterium]|nr:hypothetical protein [Pseudonocardiaceae bacterium]
MAETGAREVRRPFGRRCRPDGGGLLGLPATATASPSGGSSRHCRQRETRWVRQF